MSALTNVVRIAHDRGTGRWRRRGRCNQRLDRRPGGRRLWTRRRRLRRGRTGAWWRRFWPRAACGHVKQKEGSQGEFPSR